MAKQWYIIHTYSGHEAKAKQSLLERAKTMGKEECFDEVLIPEETVVEMVKGQKRTSKRKFFPGYIIINMHLLEENGDLNDQTWYFIKEMDGVIGFAGTKDKPAPMRRRTRRSNASTRPR